MLFAGAMEFIIEDEKNQNKNFKDNFHKKIGFSKFRKKVLSNKSDSESIHVGTAK